MIYVYGIAEAPASINVRGIGGARVHTLERAPLAAVISPLEALPAADPAALLAHESVVEAVMAEQPVLPVQFGMTLPDTAAVAALLERQQSEFCALLEGVRGCVELSVRVRWLTAGPQAAVSGRQYLEDRVQERRRAQVVHDPLAGLARLSSTRSEPGLLAAAYLVPTEEVRPFLGRLETIRDGQPELDLSCTGPWPPYSFVGPR